MARDNFSKRTITILAERVGYLCSNPTCRIHTSGPNSNSNKSTRIGKAAHMTAASIGGPRYNPSLSTTERKGIDNGIWLCGNCSDLIDKDADRFPIELLYGWKAEAEYEMFQRLKGISKTDIGDINKGPYLEANLITQRSGRAPRGYSNKNPGQFENGVYVIDISNTPIIHWELSWELSLIIYNNSSYTALNIQIEPTSEIFIQTKSTLPAVNNLKSFENLKLKISYAETLEDVYIHADQKLASKIPAGMDGTSFKLIYLDELRRKHTTIVTIDGQNIINEKI